MVELLTALRIRSSVQGEALVSGNCRVAKKARCAVLTLAIAAFASGATPRFPYYTDASIALALQSA